MSETLLDAPTVQTTGADKNGDASASPNDTSLLDTAGPKPIGPNGADAPAASADKPTTPAPKTDDAKPNGESTPPAIPEKYADPKLPDGITLDAGLKTEFDVVAKELKLSQEQYQKVVDLQVKHADSQMKRTMDVFQKQINDWAEETRKELGPDPAKSLAIAAKAIDRIFTDPTENKSFREMMRDSGLGNWRLMVKAFTFVGKAISEDRFIEGRPDSKPRKSDAEVIFDHPTSKSALTFE